MVRISRTLFKDGSLAVANSLSDLLVCPLSKQPLRHCQISNSLISDSIGVSYPIVDGIPCLAPKDGKLIDMDVTSTSSDSADNSSSRQ